LPTQNNFNFQKLFEAAVISVAVLAPGRHFCRTLRPG